MVRVPEGADHIHVIGDLIGIRGPALWHVGSGADSRQTRNTDVRHASVERVVPGVNKSRKWISRRIGKDRGGINRHVQRLEESTVAGVAHAELVNEAPRRISVLQAEG